MKTRNKTLSRKTVKKRGLNPLRVDPTRTTALRAQFVKELTRQFSSLKMAMIKLVVDEDVFGVSSPAPLSTLNAFCPTGPGGGIDPTCGAGSAAQGTGDLPRAVNIPHPKNVLQRIGAAGKTLKAKAKEAYKKLEARYGRAGATAIFVTGQAISWGAFAAGAATGQVVYIPSAVAMAPGAAVAEVVRAVKKRKARRRAARAATINTAPYLTTNKFPVLDRAHIETLARQLIEELKAELGTMLLTANSFCATGPGGGIDPTCSPGDKLLVGDNLKEVTKVSADLTDSLREIGYHPDTPLNHPLSMSYTRIEQYQQGTLVHKESWLEEDAKKFPELRQHFEPVREKIRELVGDRITLYRGADTVGGVPGKFLSSYSPEKSVAGKFLEGYDVEGNKVSKVLKTVSVPVDAIYMVVKTPNRPLEFFIQNDKLPPKLAANVFCASGPGGGVDPTCSPGESGAKASLKPKKSKAKILVGGSEKTDAELRTEVSEKKEQLRSMEDTHQAKFYHVSLENYNKLSAEEMSAYRDSVLPISRLKDDIFKAEFALGSRGRVEEIISKSRVIPDLAAAADAVGAPDTAIVDVIPGYESNSIKIIVSHPQYSAARTAKIVGGEKVMINDSFFATSQKTGLGSQVFTSQVSNLKEMGYARIETWAAKGPGMNGYYTWPRLGYDQQISEFRDRRTRERITKAFPEAKSVLDITATPEGRAWWKKNGTQMRNAKFDLADGSRSMRVLESYLAERAARTTTNSLLVNMAFLDDPKHDPTPNEDDDNPPERIEDAEEIEVDDDGEPLLFVGLPVLSLTNADQAWRFSADDEKLKAFQEWLKKQLIISILGKDEEELWKRYVEEGYRKGAGRAFDDAKRAGAVPADQSEFFAGQRDQFLRSSFGNAVAVNKVKLLVSRSFTDLRNVTEAMATQMTRSLADGLVQGMSPREIGRKMAADIDDIGKARATTIARTEIIRAHAEGQLDALQRMGVEEVGVSIEWSTTGDGKVCPLCVPLQGVILKTTEAHGMIPRHPNCRCAWIPAGLGESKTGQKNSKARILSAIKSSQAAERGKKGKSNWGPGTPISATRPKGLLENIQTFPELLAFSRVMNMFCPTGEGGGIDPTCGQGGSKLEISSWASAGFDRTTTAMFPGGVDRKLLTGALGGLPGSTVKIKTAHISEESGEVVLYASVSGPGYKATRSITRHPSGELTIENHRLDSEGGGTGTRVLAHQIESARKLGVSKIVASPSGSDGDVGDKVLPKWGFSPGRDGKYALDISDNSPGLRKFKEYAASKGITVNVFCPTGAGGGVDPTCGEGGTGGGSVGGADGGKGGTGGAGGVGGSGAKPDVTVDKSNPKTEEVMRKTFGKDVNTDDLAAASNALPGAKVKVGLTKDGGMVRVIVENPGGGVAERTFYRDHNNKLVCDNHLFINPEVKGQPKVAGADMLNNQVVALRKMGVDRIETLAGRVDNNPNGPPMVGYKVWPKLGYNGDIPDDVFSKLPPETRAAMGEKQGKLFGLVGKQKGERNIHTLYATPGGKEAWEKHGDSIPMTFDVKEGSESSKRLAAYLASRDAKKGAGDKK